MRFERMGEIEDELFAKIKEIRRTKGQEYATVEDTLADFKEVAAETGTSPLQVWATYVKKHQRAIDTFVREGEVKSEAIEGRVLDTVVYHILLLGLIEDLQEIDKGNALAEFVALDGPQTKCGAIGTVSQHDREDAIICCELLPGHSGVHYGRTVEHHGYQWEDREQADEERAAMAKARHVFAPDDELHQGPSDPMG
jgi:hypothetical protein